MTAPAPDPRLVTLLGEHLQLPGFAICAGCGEPWEGHLAAEVEAHVQERIAEALDKAADDRTSPASEVAHLTPEARRWLRDRAAAQSVGGLLDDCAVVPS